MINAKPIKYVNIKDTYFKIVFRFNVLDKDNVYTLKLKEVFYEENWGLL